MIFTNLNKCFPLKIVHSAVGLTPSSIGVTLPQVFSRVFLIWPILFKVPESRDEYGFPMLLMAWTITEILRYLYYALNLISMVPSFLVWCRYIMFRKSYFSCLTVVNCLQILIFHTLIPYWNYWRITLLLPCSSTLQCNTGYFSHTSK